MEQKKLDGVPEFLFGIPREPRDGFLAYILQEGDNAITLRDRLAGDGCAVKVLRYRLEVDSEVT